MSTAYEATGLALLCDLDGTIHQVIRDELGLAERVEPGRSLTSLVDRASFQKALNFLFELRTQTATFNWELNMVVADQLVTLHFGGVIANDKLLIMAARSRNGVLELYEELMRISNEQINQLRLLSKEQNQISQARFERDHALYNQISRLNNELVTLQRELAKRNAEQETLNQELRRLNELKNTFVGMAAHDIRGPLANIQLAAQFLLESDRLTQNETKQLLGDIAGQAGYMLTLVADLLDVSQIELGRLDLKLTTVELAGFLAEVVQRYDQLAHAKNTQVLLVSVNPGSIAADPLRLRQVLDNLLSNAVKFSPPGSTVTVSAQPLDPGWRINVHDQGPGITAADRQFLFQDFARLSARPTGGEASTGLGLAISRRVVEAHGGHIGVDSTPGHGSTFWFTIPR